MSFRNCSRLVSAAALLAILSVAGGCSSIDRLSQIGEQPKLAAIYTQQYIENRSGESPAAAVAGSSKASKARCATGASCRGL